MFKKLSGISPGSFLFYVKLFYVERWKQRDVLAFHYYSMKHQNRPGVSSRRFSSVLAANNDSTIYWSDVQEGVYDPLHPFTLLWSGDVLSSGGFDLDTMSITNDSSKADFVINQYGDMGADQIAEIDPSQFAQPMDSQSVPFPASNTADVKQGGGYLIYMDDGRYAQIRIDRYMPPTKAMFSFVIEGEEPTPVVTLSDLQASEQDITLNAGESISVSLTGKYSVNTEKDVTALAQWTSSNTGVVTVSKGNISGVQPGQATIRASLENKEVSLNVTVTEENHSEDFELVLNESDFTFEPGEQLRFNVYKKYKDGTMVEVTEEAVYFSTSKKNVNIVPGMIVVPETASLGTYQVTISYEGKSKEMDVIVSKVQLEKLIASPAVVTLEIGEVFEIGLKARYSDNSSKDVTTIADWMSDDPQVVQINSGELKALSSSYAEVTANFEGKEVTVHVYVNPKRSVTSLEVSERNVKIVRGDKIQPMVYATFNKGGKERVLSGIVWSSRNGSVASVNSLGVVTGKSTGKTTIDVTYEEETVSFTIEVTAEKAVTKLEADRTNIQMALDSKWPVKVYATYEDGSKEEVTNSAVWSAAVGTIANVSNDGLVEANGLGSTEVFAEYRGKTIAVEVEVFESLKKSAPINHLPWEEKKVGTAKQAWTIAFNSGLDETTVNAESIYITDKNNNVVPVFLNLANEGRELIVTPVGTFEPNMTYYLNITTEVYSTSGAKLKQAVVMEFKVN